MKLLLLSALMVTGCGWASRLYTHITNEVTFKCVRGVTYIQSDSGLTLLVSQDGKPVTCSH